MKIFANNEQLQGIIRQLLGLVAAVGLAQGWFDDATSQILVTLGMAMAVLVLSWNSLDKDTFREQLEGIARHALGFLAGIGIIVGEQQAQSWMTWAGIIIAVLVVAWSVFRKKDKTIPVSKANTLPRT